MRITRTILAALLVATACGFAAAQSGGLTVKVTDAENNPLAGATVTLSNSLGYMKTETQISNAKGLVDFPVLRPGEGYSLEVGYPGFAKTVRSLRIKLGQTITEPVAMLSEFQEEVKVIAGRPTIDLDQTEAATNFGGEFIQDLPVAGRNYQNVLTLAPGVQDSDGDGNPNVNGSRARDFKASIGGVSNVDPLTGYAFQRVNANSIEEMEVITAGAGVEYGRAQGGYANIIQKQGGNEHEGVVEFYFRSSLLDGTGANDTNRIADQDFDWWQPGFQFSGPVVRDKLWYRLSHEGRDIEVPINTINDIVIQKTQEGTHSDQLTWQLTPRNKLAFNIAFNPSNADNIGVDSRTPAESSFTRDTEADNYTLTWDAPYSSKLLVRTVAGWQDEKIELSPTSPGAQNRCPTNGLPFLENATCNDLIDGLTSGPGLVDRFRRTQRFTLNSQATLFGGRFWGMSHQFQFGLQVENERFFQERDQNTFVQRSVFRDPEDPDPDPVTRLDVVMALPDVREDTATSTNWSLFVEDQFRPWQKATFTLGLRLYRTEVNAEGQGLFGSQRPEAEFARYLQRIADRPDVLGNNTQLQNVFTETFTGAGDTEGFKDTVATQVCAGVPASEFDTCFAAARAEVVQVDGFLGFAERKRGQDDIDIGETNLDWQFAFTWSPFDNGKTAIKGTARRTYGFIPLNVPLLESQEQVAFAYGLTGDDDDNIPDILDPARPRVDINQIDRNLKIPHTDEFSLRYERELWPETRMAVTVIHRKGRDQLQDININLGVGDFGQCGVVNSPDDAPLERADNPVNIFGGDGIIDDCQGEQEPYFIPGDTNDDPFTATGEYLTLPDGFADLYVLNPNFGDVYEVGNYNEIDYDSIQLELIRNQYRSWEFQASYVWSKAEGDGEDFAQALGDDPTLRDDEFGYLSYDQRHVVKFNATTVTPWGIRLGTAASWQSGLPFSLLRREASRDAIARTILPGQGGAITPFNRTRTVYVTRERNDQRNPSWWNFDVRATKEMNLGRNLNLQLSAEVFNLLNEDPLRVFFRQNGFNAANRAFGRRWQIGAKVAF